MKLITGTNTFIHDSVVFRPFSIDGVDLPIIIGDNCEIHSGTVIYGGCRIGNNVKIYHNSVISWNVHIGDNSRVSHLCVIESDVYMGSHSYLGVQSHLTRFTVVEDYVAFSGMICTSNDKNMRYMRKETEEGLKGPVFKRGVRIGIMATILPGVVVGENAFIGSGAVVTKDVEPNAIVYGVPAVRKGTVPEEDRL